MLVLHPSIHPLVNCSIFHTSVFSSVGRNKSISLKVNKYSDCCSGYEWSWSSSEIQKLHPPCRRHLSPQLVRLLAELQDVWNCSLHSLSLDDFHRPTLRTITSKCPKLATTKCRSYNRTGTASAPWWTGNLSFPIPSPRRETENGWMDTLRHKTCSITVPVSNFKKERSLQWRH